MHNRNLILYLLPVAISVGLIVGITNIFPVAHAASGGHLFVSAENSQFNNYFAGPQVIQVIVSDSDIFRLDQPYGEPTVTVNGKKLRMAQATDGNWYAYFADSKQAQNADSTVRLDGKGLDFGKFCSATSAITATGVDFSETKGIAIANSGAGSVNGNPNPVATVSNTCSALATGDRIEHVVRENKTLNTNPDLLGKTGQIGFSSQAVWPVIQLYDFASLPSSVQIDYQRMGGDEITSLTFDRIPTNLISLATDSPAYNNNTQVHVTVNDPQLNIDPTDVDSWTWGSSSANNTLYYQAFDRNGAADADGTAGMSNLIPILTTFMFNYNGKLTVDPAVQGVRAIDFQDNDKQILLPTRGDPVLVHTFSISNSSQPITFIEKNVNSGIFKNDDNSNTTNIITVNNYANQLFSLRYNDLTTTIGKNPFGSGFIKIGTIAHIRVQSTPNLGTIKLPLVSTSDTSFNNYTFTEIAPDAGIYIADILMTPGQSNPSGSLHVNVGDYVTLVQGDNFYVASIYKTSLPELYFDSSSYSVGGLGVVSLLDPEASTGVGEGKITVRLNSTNDTAGIDMVLLENSANKGRFENALKVNFLHNITSTSNVGNPLADIPGLKVSTLGDTVNAVYNGSSNTITTQANIFKIVPGSQGYGSNGNLGTPIIGRSTFLVASVVCTSDSYGGDTDGDHICNTWEPGNALTQKKLQITFNGATFSSSCSGDGGGTDTCPLPTKKDVYVEVGWISPYQLTSTAITALKGAFSPHSIVLHILQDPSQTPGISNPFLETCSSPPCNTIQNTFDYVKQNNFGMITGTRTTALAQMAQVFHYALMVNTISGDTGSSGYGEYWGNDFIVSLGSFPNTDINQEATFMHELGHNLGLGHGGNMKNVAAGTWNAITDYDLNCKPNYLSVMNYVKQFPGYFTSHEGALNRPLDYSVGALPTLIESNLNEGFGSTVPSSPQQFAVWPNPQGTTTYSTATLPDSTIDLDHSPNPPTSSYDVDDFNIHNCYNSPPTTGDNLIGHDDWSNLLLDFTGSANYGPGMGGVETNHEMTIVTFKTLVKTTVNQTLSFFNSDDQKKIKGLISDSNKNIDDNNYFGALVDIQSIRNNLGSYGLDHEQEQKAITEIDGIIVGLKTLVPSEKPRAPTDLHLDSINSTNVNLKWTAPSENASTPITGYKIERSDGTVPRVIQENTHSMDTFYSDGRPADGTYTYSISAINSAGVGDSSSVEVKVKTIPEFRDVSIIIAIAIIIGLLPYSLRKIQI